MNRGEDFIGDADCGSTTAIGFLVGQREEESGRWLLVFRDGHGGVGAVEREISNCRGLVTLPLIPVPCGLCRLQA
ncbi:hypothetical protein LINPERHAP1_LOCUS20789 [Linum perenne]